MSHRLAAAAAMTAIGLSGLLEASPARAQSGTIVGEIHSVSERGPVASVRVRVLDAGSRVRAAERTDGRGRFRIDGLDTGSYAIVASLPGWRDARREDVKVRAGDTTRVWIELQPAPIALNPITVTGGRRPERLLEAPASITVIDREEVERRPALTVLGHVDGIVGVDVVRTGLENGYVVTRGFNELFAASLLMLADHRIARTPSLRANLPRVLSTTNLDIDRIEVVRGPASVLYGPDAAGGVLHVLTKSPIDHPGFSAAVGGGSREQDRVPGFDPSTEGLLQAEARYAARFGERLGAKLSGRWLRGTDWRQLDPVEQDARTVAQACLADLVPTNPACATFASAPGTPPDPERLSRIGARDFEVGHWALDGRADWRPDPETALVASAGLERTENSLDQTVAGTTQTKDAITWYGQARLDRGPLFAQVYLTKNEIDGPDETFFLRSGQAARDHSSLLVGQVQHSVRPTGGHRFTYGLDVLRTTPDTDGLLNGIHEREDGFTQLGAYIQSETELSDRWDLMLAARADHHSVLEGVVFSPRAALVFEPSVGHSLRATFGRAFETPGANQLFNDLLVQRIPLGGSFGYGIRLQGGAGAGFTFPRIAGRPAMKSPFAPLRGRPVDEALPSTTGELYRLGRELLRATGSPAAELLDAVGVPAEDEVSPVLLRLDPGTGSFVPAGGFEAVTDIPPLQEQITNTFEIGYKGVPADGLRVTADLYYTRRENVLGPVRVETPNIFLHGEELVAFLLARGIDEETARTVAIGTEEAPGLARIPLGVIQPAELSDPSPTLLLAVRNFGNVDLFGADFAVDYAFAPRWSLGLALSWVSDDRFDADGLEVALNAPTVKTRASISYDDAEAGRFARLTHRFVNGFPALSGVFTGRVDDYQIVDLTLGWQPPLARELSLQLQVENLLDEGYRAFPGAPELGRLVQARVGYGF